MKHTKEVEIHLRGREPLRRELSILCKQFEVPFLNQDGYGIVRYVASGRYTKDGLEIWRAVLGAERK